MPPKSGEKDDLGTVKGQLQAKDLILLCSVDNVNRLEERARMLEEMIRDSRRAAAARDRKLEDEIASLTRYAKESEVKNGEMERAIVLLRQERTETKAAMMGELNTVKNQQKGMVDDVRSQLDEAYRFIQEIKEFKEARASIVKNIQELRDRLGKEQKEHQEALGDVERVAAFERDRLRKDMAVRIEETKVQMIQQTHEQLHYKTKRTILENDQLSKEVAYHLRQAELLAAKNEQLGLDNIIMEDQLLTATQLEEELSKKNHDFQKAARILLFKLQEQHLSTNLEVIREVDEVKHLIARHGKIKKEIQKDQQDVGKVKATIEAKTKKAEKCGATDEALKFLYLAVEDVELEEVACGDTSMLEDGNILQAPDNSLAELSIQQRRTFISHFMRTAISLRAMMEGALASDSPPGVFGAWADVLYTGQNEKPKITVEDALAFEAETEEILAIIPMRRVSRGVQTEVARMPQEIPVLPLVQ